ncbi:MAG: MATE family efflux transporter [Clostridiales bacterium]|nr:MATE family efflux transporter [Clostridiales bacterium]
MNETKNPLGEKPLNSLLAQFAVPSIVAMLVSSLYNIVDQFFIGRSVGELGNAATNISFPLSILCVGISLLFGIGGASAFNISMGEGNKEKAVGYLGNAAVMLVLCGLVLTVITSIFLQPLMIFFGSPDNVLGYAKQYTRIIAFGFPFLVLTTGGGHLIRADGRPRIAMTCNLTGAIINTCLDAIFVFVLGWGMRGAAAATVIGQVISAMLALWYLSHCKTVRIKRGDLILRRDRVARVASLGAAPCSNQLAMMVVQIVMNNSLKHYGALSEYGDSIPIACVGIITKVNQICMSFIIGISQGLQPIASFNYGAKKYSRVRSVYLRAISCGFVIGVVAFLLFQLAPRQIISIFGDGSELYYQFAIRYFRIYLFFTFANFLQPITSNFFTAIGKPTRGVFLSLTRQIIFFLPLLVIFPLFMGIDGIMYVGPIADFLALVVTIIMIVRELRNPRYKA